MRDALRKHVAPGQTPQTEQARADQVKNSAGGYVFKASDKTILNRFLTLGTEGGMYYVNERNLTRDNAQRVIQAAESSERMLLTETLAVSEAGRAPRNNPALFALAAAGGLGNLNYRTEALDLLPRIARTGSHLLFWAEYIEMFRGWGRALTKAVGNWYTCKTPEDLAYQLLKYKQREGWSQRDLMRLSHFGRNYDLSAEQKAVFAYMMKGDFDARRLPPLIDIAEQAHETRNTKDWVRLIGQSRSLTHEMLPSEALAKKDVWLALIENGNLPLGALLRNLSRLTRLGIIGPMSWHNQTIANRLLNQEHITKARIHPIAVLLALKTYALGHSIRGQSAWTPEPSIIDTLDEMYYKAFGNIEPANKRTVIATDVSLSMSWQIAGYPFAAWDIAGALAMVMARTEPQYALTAFHHGITPLPISPRQRLDDVIRMMHGLSHGGTDTSLPMRWAIQQGLAVDTFRIITDNETWAGSMHTHEALKAYRKFSGIDSRLQVIACTPTEFSIADPLDPRQLDVSGFDSAVPALLADHARGDL